MRKTALLVLALSLVGCMTWKSPINSNTLIAEDRVPIDGEVFYHGSIDASETVSYFLQSGGRLVRLNFDFSAKREGEKVMLSFTKADFNGNGLISYQDLVRVNYLAETRENESFDSEIMRHPIDVSTLKKRLGELPEYSESDERALLELIGLLLKCVALENFNTHPYAGNLDLLNTQVDLFGYAFKMSSASTIREENAGLFNVGVETQLSASYFLKYPAKDGGAQKTTGVYYSIGGKDRSQGTYFVDTLLVKQLDLSLVLKGFQQTYFADKDELYYLEPTRVRVRINLEQVKVSS